MTQRSAGLLDTTVDCYKRSTRRGRYRPACLVAQVEVSFALLLAPLTGQGHLQGLPERICDPGPHEIDGSKSSILHAIMHVNGAPFSTPAALTCKIECNTLSGVALWALLPGLTGAEGADPQREAEPGEF